MVRVAAYIDGFNLYFGLKAKHGRKFLWLDLQALATSLLLPGQVLTQVTYFTARVRSDIETSSASRTTWTRLPARARW